MSLKLGGGNKKTTTNSTTNASGTMASTTNPWAATIPQLDQFLSSLGGASTGLGTLSPGQTGALGEISANAARAGQFTPNIEGLTRDLFSTESTSPLVTDAYRTLQGNLNPIASGSVNPMDDPAFKTLIDSVASDAMNRTNSMFAGAGRDLSPANSAAAARAVTNATAPILVGQYNTNIGRRMDAANTLFGAGQSTATTSQGLDDAALATRERGINTASAALDSLNLPANIRLQVEEQLKSLPINELGLVAQQLFAAAGLGSQTAGTQTQTQNTKGAQKTSGTNWGLGFAYPSAK